MNKKHLLELTTVILLCVFLTAQARADDGRPDKINQCVACHGALGISNYTFFPNIAGQKRTYMMNQLRAFRDGRRYDPWMSPIAIPLSDADIEELATFYSELK